MLKPNETYLRCKQTTITWEKMSPRIKGIFWEKGVWSFKTLNPTSHAK